MKKIFFAILCSAAVISCAKEEVITAEKEAITFENAFVDNATKALDDFTVTKDNLATFKVWGTTQMPGAAEIVPIFVEEAVSSTDNGATWTYAATSTQYWIPGNTYVFAAAKNYESAGLDDGVPATFVYDAATQADLLYDATATLTGAVAGSNSSVEFTFEHLLSKAYFTVHNDMSNANQLYTYRISNIAINNAVKKATYYVDGQEWKDVEASYSSTEPLRFGNVNGNADADTEDAVKIPAHTHWYTSHHSRLLIPATYDDLNITCTIETLYDDAVIDVENYNRNIDFTFVKGHSYNFIFFLKEPGDEIHFDVVDVNGWNTDHNNDDIYGDDERLPNMDNQRP